jgi:ABC-type lipoprotein export system ATPase subunit
VDRAGSAQDGGVDGSVVGDGTAAVDASVGHEGTRIDLDGVSRRYHVGDVDVVALDSVDLHVDESAFVVILGPSGSGKTTLLNMIGALDSPSAGTVRVNGADLTAAKQTGQPLRRSVAAIGLACGVMVVLAVIWALWLFVPGSVLGIAWVALWVQSRRGGAPASRPELAEFRRSAVSFIFQTFNLFPALTALENVQFGADAAGRSRAADRAAEALEQVGLGDRMHHFPHQLSGGEQQRVAIARALASGNPILLADEPTGELDFRTGVQILQVLEEQAREGMTVLVVTHNREISRIADRVIELSSGHIVADGPPAGGKSDIGELQW